MQLEGKELVGIYPTNVFQKPLVSVIIQTYNQEKYISTCLDSIISQETNFEYEILLSEDDSSDNTRSICIEYAQKYPEKIRLFLHDRRNNIKIDNTPTGRYPFIWNLFNARGKYIAICEGDDYWTDSLKLQKQVDFLETNPEYSFCFHNTQELKGGKIVNSYLNREENKIFTIKDLLVSNMMHTCSMIFRHNLIEIPDWYFKLNMGDYPLQILLAQKGKLYCIAENMAVYRRNVGIWSKLNHREKQIKMIDSYNIILENLNFNKDERIIFENMIIKHMNNLNVDILSSYNAIKKRLYVEQVQNLNIIKFIKLKLYKVLSQK